MKRIKYLLFSLLLGIIMVGSVNAAGISVSASKMNVTVGNTFKVTVTVTGTGTTSGTAMAWEYCLDYDSSKLTLVDGATCVNDGVLGLVSPTQTYTFKAKTSGTSKISVKNAAVYDAITEAAMAGNFGGVTITAKTQAEIQASYSTNADLKALSVTNYEISPEFNKDTLEYNLEVENEISTININATRADSSASVSGIGEKQLLEGKNKFEIVVTAEKGNKKTYIINVNRKELNPIKRTIYDTDYTVVRKIDGIEVPSYYTESTVTIDGEEVPAWTSEITGYTLVSLKDEDGNTEFFRYVNGDLKAYVQLSTPGVTFIVEETTDKVSGYDKEKEVEINDKKVKGYVNSTDEDFVLVYGMNASNGEKGWYLYDTKESTFQRYNNAIVTEESKGYDLYFILTIVFVGVSALSILLVILLMSKNSKIKKKNDKLISIIEGKKEQRDQKIADRFDSISDLEEDELKALEETIKLQREQNELKNQEQSEQEQSFDKDSEEDTEETAELEVSGVDAVEKEIINNIAKANDKSFDDEDDIVEKITSVEEDNEDTNTVDVDIEDIMENTDTKDNKTMSFTQRLIEEPVGQPLSKRELRRLEKIKRQEEKDELKKLQEDFFSTNEYKVVDEKTDESSEEVVEEKETKKRKKRK